MIRHYVDAETHLTIAACPDRYGMIRTVLHGEHGIWHAENYGRFIEGRAVGPVITTIVSRRVP